MQLDPKGLEAARTAVADLCSTATEAVPMAHVEATVRAYLSALPASEAGWRDMESAPKDGTRIWLLNDVMEYPVIGKWADYRSKFSGVSKQWIVTDDPHDQEMPLAYGTLCVPTRWMPLPSAPDRRAGE